MLSALSTEKKCVGVKQTRRAIKEGAAVRVFVAEDAQAHVIRPVIAACDQAGIEIVRTESMAQLGEACGIDVGCAVAALLR